MKSLNEKLNSQQKTNSSAEAAGTGSEDESSGEELLGSVLSSDTRVIRKALPFYIFIK